MLDFQSASRRAEACFAFYVNFEPSAVVCPIAISNSFNQNPQCLISKFLFPYSQSRNGTQVSIDTRSCAPHRAFVDKSRVFYRLFVTRPILYNDTRNTHLINFDWPIDFVHEHPTWKKTNGSCRPLLVQPWHKVRADRGLTCQNEEEEANQCAVTEVEDTRSEAPKTDTTKPIDHCICKNIACGSPSGVESPPLPVIVLAAEQKVNQ